MVLLILPLIPRDSAVHATSSAGPHLWRRAEPTAALVALAAQRVERVVKVELEQRIVTRAALAATSEAVPGLEVRGARRCVVARRVGGARVREA